MHKWRRICHRAGILGPRIDSGKSSDSVSAIEIAFWSTMIQGIVAQSRGLYHHHDPRPSMALTSIRSKAFPAFSVKRPDDKSQPIGIVRPRTVAAAFNKSQSYSKRLSEEARSPRTEALPAKKKNKEPASRGAHTAIKVRPTFGCLPCWGRLAVVLFWVTASSTTTFFFRVSTRPSPLIYIQNK